MDLFNNAPSSLSPYTKTFKTPCNVWGTIKLRLMGGAFDCIGMHIYLCVHLFVANIGGWKFMAFSPKSSPIMSGFPAKLRREAPVRSLRAGGTAFQSSALGSGCQDLGLRS